MKTPTEQILSKSDISDLEIRIDDLTLLSEGWDGYDGHRVTLKVAEYAKEVISVIAPLTKLAPHVVPVPNGGIQFEWFGSLLEIELEVGPELSIAVYIEYFDVESPMEFEVSLFSELTEIGEHFQRL